MKLYITMFNKHFSHIKPHFLLFLIACALCSCNYKDSNFFAPTTSIPGDVNTLAAPSLTYPSNGAADIGINLTFEWQQIPNALGYEFQLKKTDESYIDANSIVVDGITSNTYEYEGLDFSADYNWRVRAFEGDIFSDFSLEYTFTTQDEPISNYTLTVDTEGEGTINTNDNLINCGSDCTEEYEEGSEVTLSTEPANGWFFERWSGDVPEECKTDNPSCTLSMDMARSVTAHFIQEDNSDAPSITDLSGNWRVNYTFTFNSCTDQSGEFEAHAEISILNNETNEIGVEFPDADDIIRGIYNTSSGPDAGWFTGMTDMVDLGGYYGQEFWDGQFYLMGSGEFYTGTSLVEYSTGMEPEDVFCKVEYDVTAEKE